MVRFSFLWECSTLDICIYNLAIFKGLRGDIVQLNDALIYLLNNSMSKSVETLTGLSKRTIHTLKYRLRALMRLGREQVIFNKIV